MKKIIITVLIVIGTMFLSCPTKADYVCWFSEKLMEDSHGVTRVLGNALAPSLINELTSEDNYLILKLYNTEDLDGNTYKTWGLFNSFIYVGAEDAIHDYTNEESSEIKEENNVITGETETNETETYDTETYDTDICGEITEGDEYSNYQNARYGFSADFPRDFIMDRPPDNGSGLAFYSKDGLAKLTIAGINNSLNETVEEYFNEELASVINPAYKLQKDNWYVISWEEAGMIYYIKSYVGQYSCNILRFNYPSSQKDEYSSIVEHLSKSLIPGDINESF